MITDFCVIIHDMEGNFQDYPIGSKCVECGEIFVSESLVSGVFIPRHSQGALTIGCPGSEKTEITVMVSELPQVRAKSEEYNDQTKIIGVILSNSGGTD